VDQGQKCIACHVNPTGGGLRNAYGVHFARSGLAAYRLPDSVPGWDGRVGDWLRLGGDWRWSSTRTDVPQQPRQRSAGTDQLRAYAGLTPAGRTGAALRWTSSFHPARPPRRKPMCA
jgi:hypothetical protein